MDDYNQKRVLILIAIFLVAGAIITFFLWRLAVQDYEETSPFEEPGQTSQPNPVMVERTAVYVVAVTTDDGYGGAGFFIYSTDNKTEWHVVTNQHIVENDISVSVYWPEANQEIDNVPVLVSDKISDVAILDLQPQDFRVDRYVDGLEHLKNAGAGVYVSSQRPSAETPVFTFGFPDSAQGQLTKTTGNVRERRFHEYCGGQPEVNWIAIDNETSRPGFSGGPVFSYEGAILGMNSCGPSDEYSGLATPMAEIQGRIKTLNSR